MNPILKTQFQARKYKELKKHFTDVKLDQACSEYAYITKLCFTRYDIKKLVELGVEVIGFSSRNDQVELQVKL